MPQRPFSSSCYILLLLLCPAPLFGGSVLNFPRLSSADGLLTGVAIVNPTASQATVAITAYGSDGNPLKGEGVTNPVSVTIPAGQQYSKLTLEIFGSALPESSASWFQASSSTDNLTGFFLFLNSSLSLMDGADSPVAAQKIIFNNIRIDAGFSSELNIVNPGSAAAHISLQLAGTYFPPAAQTLTIPAHGAVRLDAASFFPISTIQPGAYVIVDSDSDIAGLELVRSPAADCFAFNARRSAEQLGSLYFLQLSVLGSFSSQLALVNYSADPVVLTISAFKPDGSLYDASSLKFNPVTRSLNSKASLSEDLKSMFGFSGDAPLDGWILVKSTSDAVNGFITHGDSSTGAVASVPSSAQGRNRAIFSHIATTTGFSTAINLLNPGSVAANVRILALDKTGAILGVFDTVLQPSQRFYRSLGTSDLIPAAANQTGGLVFIKSDQPVYMSSLIRSSGAWVNIPAQPAPDSYNPDSAISSLKMIPPIAIIPPGSSQRFSVSGSSSSLTWKVNGTTGGSPASGTITSAGVFTAPKAVPARQVVTITAESSSQAAGASADVLDKVPFTAGLGVVQSVTFLESLGKVYAAELAALAAAPSAALAATGNSQIIEVPPSGTKIAVALFPGEVISKIISFKADNGSQFLLLAAQTSGRIIRLEPVSKAFIDVVTGLNQPSSIVIDSASGDLLIVEKDKISTIAKAALQAGLSNPDGTPLSAPGRTPSPFASLVLPASGGTGIAVDRCTGFIYYSLADQGTVIQYHPAIGTSLIVATGLLNPGQILGIYREDVTCPDSFQLLVAERGANRVVLIVPSRSTVVPWLDSPGISDLSFAPHTSTTSTEGVLLADHSIEVGGQIFLVPLSNLYENKPPNPPEIGQVEPKVNLGLSQSHSPNPVLAYQNLTFTITVSNHGPDKATGVSLTDTLPANASLLAASSSQGNCGGAGALVNCNLGSIPVNGTVTVTVNVAPGFFSGTGPGTLRNTAVVTSIEVDTDPANNTSTEDAVVSAPQPAKLEIAGLPSQIAAGEAANITVTVKDLGGKIVPGYTGTVHFTSTDSSAILPANYTFQSSDAGVHSFSVSFRASGNWLLTVADTILTSLTGSAKITVIPNQAASLEVSASPSNLTAGGLVTVTVTAKDAEGNTATGFVGPVFMGAFPTYTGSGSETFVQSSSSNGVFIFSVRLYLAGSRTIEATSFSLASPSIAKNSGSMTGSSGGVSTSGNPPLAAQGIAEGLIGSTSVTVAAGPLDHLGLSPATASIPAGGNQTYTAAGQDLYNNFLGDVTASTIFTISPEGFCSIAICSGTLAAAHTVTGTYSGKTGTATLTITAGAPAGFTLTGIPNPTVRNTTLTVSAIDSFSNPVTGYTGPVRFTSSDSSATVNGAPIISFQPPLAGGTGSFTVGFSTCTGSPTVTLTVYDVGNASIFASITPTRVVGSASKFAISGLPGSATAGDLLSPSITAQDACNNTAIGFTGATTFTSTDPQVSLPNGGLYTFSAGDAGTKTFAGGLTLKTATISFGWTLTATAAGPITGTSAEVNITAGTVTKFAILGMPPSSSLGLQTPIVSVWAVDAFGNPNSSYGGSATLSCTDTSAAFSYPFSGPPLLFNLGLGEFQITFNAAGNWFVTATDTGNSSITGTVGPINVGP